MLNKSANQHFGWPLRVQLCSNVRMFDIMKKLLVMGGAMLAAVGIYKYLNGNQEPLPPQPGTVSQTGSVSAKRVEATITPSITPLTKINAPEVRGL